MFGQAATVWEENPSDVPLMLIMDAENFNVAHKFPENEKFSPPNFVCLGENFPAGKNRGDWAIARLPCHDAIVAYNINAIVYGVRIRIIGR